MASSFLPIFLAVCLLLSSAFAQPGYQSGNFMVYPPQTYTYPSVTTFAQINLYVATMPNGTVYPTTVNGNASNLGRARGQWSLTMYTRENKTSAWSTALNCSNPGYEACPWQQNMQSMGEGQIKVEYKWINQNKNYITMINSTSMVPTSLEFYMCYSNVAFDDRPWRKKNKAYPSLTHNCYFLISTNLFPSQVNPQNITASQRNNNNLIYNWENNITNSVTGFTIYNMNYNNDLPTASLFFHMWVRCSDGNVCAYESTESTSTNNSTGLYYPLPYAATSRYIFVNGPGGSLRTDPLKCNISSSIKNGEAPQPQPKEGWERSTGGSPRAGRGAKQGKQRKQVKQGRQWLN